MSDARHELSMQLATGFAAMCMDYLPVVEEGLRRTDQRISFGAKVVFWKDKDGALRGRRSSRYGAQSGSGSRIGRCG